MQTSNIKQNIIHGTMVIFIVTIVAKIVAFLTSSILAYYLGTSEQSDAYYTVLSVDQVFYPMLGVGIWNIFLPIYKEKLVIDSQEKVNKFGDLVLTFFSIISVVVVLALIFFSRGIVQILAPGFSQSTKILTGKLIKISAPMYFFTISAAIYAAMLQCHNNFLGSQMREVVVNIPIIIAAVFFYKYYGIYSLAVALLCGGACRLIVALPFVNWGYRYKPVFSINDPDMKVLMKRFPSAMLSQGVNQMNMLVDRIMASSLSAGAVSALNYGNKLMSVLNGLLSTSVTTALYPQVVELITIKEFEKLGKLLSKVINIFLFVMVPITVYCALFSKNIVAVVYQRGAFNNESGRMTSEVFMFYCLALFFMACNTMLQNFFYAKGDTWTPFVYSAINLISNIILNSILIRIYGIAGLSLATSISAAFAYLFLIIRINTIIKFEVSRNFNMVALTLLLSAVATVISKISVYFMPNNKYILLVVSAVIFFGVYIFFAKILKMHELDAMIGIVKARFKRK